LTFGFHSASNIIRESNMEPDTSKAIWSRFWNWLDRFAMAVEYDPLEELRARVSRLEGEIGLLRQDPNRALPTPTGGPKR
jgi:hypothetical protein